MSSSEKPRMRDPQEREHFARRAAELRTMALGATDDEIRRTLETMAMSYEEIRDIKGKSAHWPIYVAIAGGAAAVVLGVMFHELSKD